MTRALPILLTLAVAAAPRPAAAQGAAAGPTDSVASAVSHAARGATTADPPATLFFANRAIVELRATVLSRPPSARAASAANLMDRLATDRPAGRVTSTTFPDGTMIAVDGHPVIVVFAADVDPLVGESLDAKAAGAAARLQTAFAEAVELRTPGRIAYGVGRVLLATLLFAGLLWLVVRIDRRIAEAVLRRAEQRLARLPGAEVIAGIANTAKHVRRAFTVLTFVLGAVLTYVWAAAILRSLPYTRPWGESLRSGLVGFALSMGRGFVAALPDLAVVGVVIVATRFFTRLATLFFNAIEQKRLTVPSIYPDTAAPTRRIVVALLWMCALIVSYPYLPGSQSDVFKGVSVFLGLVISLGSTGVMNQLMSGLMVTYSRALKPGDYVRTADVEGTVTAIGALSTKIRTPKNEEITIPNAVVVSNATTNFSEHLADGVYAPTAVTIGYDTPWRQVRALLLAAADGLPGMRSGVPPVVLQTGLQDWYVEYTLFVPLDRPERRYFVLDELHARIQDRFNEYGVQIMSPHYVLDPAGAKVVPPSRWYTAPAPADEAPQPAARAAPHDHVSSL